MTVDERIQDAFPELAELSGNHDALEELIGMLRVARSQRDTAEQQMRSMSEAINTKTFNMVSALREAVYGLEIAKQYLAKAVADGELAGTAVPVEHALGTVTQCCDQARKAHSEAMATL